MSVPEVRFDSLDALRGPRAFRFEGPRGVVRADAIEAVVPALAEVERAVASGLHAAGFVAYEAAPAFDPALETHPPDPRVPLLWFALYERRIETAGESSLELVPPGESASGDEDSGTAIGPFVPGMDPATHAAAVARIHEWIAAGDSYQVNLTFPLTQGFHGSARDLYSRLCRSQRSAYCAYLDFGEGVAVSASPELFFHRQGAELVLRPMKGTRPRGRWCAEDQALARELADSPKDRAENLMIVDLLRNDAGRVARFGSVRVEEMFAVEHYPTVHQMTSTVRAEVGPEVTLTDLFRGLFPCGSITGAPKVRTSAIITELETGPRGIYTGAIGIVSPEEAIFSVAIRTLCLYPDGEAVLGVGGGITHDSVAAHEYQECLDKAAFLSRPPPAALLETMRYEPGAGFLRLDRHLARMGWSASLFGVRFDAEELRARLDALVDELPSGPRRVRITLDQSGSLDITHAEAPRWEEPVRLRQVQRTLPSGDPRWYHKSTDRSLYAVEGMDGDEALFVNERGELAETAIANLVLELDGELWTPALECGLLPGVLRGELLDQGRVRERILTEADLARASRMWVINSLRGWGRAVLADAAVALSAGEAAKKPAASA